MLRPARSEKSLFSSSFVLICLAMLLAGRPLGGSPIVQTSPGPPAAPSETAVSLQLYEVSLLDFFKLLGDLTLKNIVVDSDVRGTLSLFVHSASWKEILDAVLESHALASRQKGSLMRIMRQNTLERESRGQPSRQTDETPLETMIHHLDFANPADLREKIEGQTFLLSGRGQLLIDERSRNVIVTDTSEHLRRLRRTLESLDQPDPQVEIEARIVEVTAALAREIGMQLGFFLGSPGARNRASAQFHNLGEDSQTLLSFSTGRPLDTLRLDALLSAGEVEGQARILSKPRVCVLNDVQAVITQGSKIPVPVNSNFSTRVRFETAALRLTVRPLVTNPDTIHLTLKLENNVPDFTRTVFGIPTILTSEAETEVSVADGGTLVIGGIRVEMDRHAEDRVPGLARIPWIGRAFRRSGSERQTREILFFLTCRLKATADD